MNFVCLWSQRWQTGADSATELASALLACVPRVVVEQQGKGLIWADARGLDPHTLVPALAELLRQHGNGDDAASDAVRMGMADTPIVAEVAAAHSKGTVTIVEHGGDACFLAPFPISVLAPSPPLRALLDGIGVDSCRDLALLDREAIEVRLGAEGVHLWRLARADDRRHLFTSVERSLPHASMDWVDYALRDPERLIFVLNALVGRVCASLDERGEVTRELALVFSLANGERCTRQLRAARPMSSRRMWMRQIRDLLDRLVLPDAVTGILLRIESVATRRVPQGDLFDRGFASARATEEALAQLIDDQGEIVLVPESSGHSLLEARTRWIAQDPARLSERGAVRESVAPESFTPRLTLWLLPDPRPIAVATGGRRDHASPLRYHEGSGWHEIIDAAGPDRVSGGHWEAAYAREYFRCVRNDGLLLWLFRDARGNRWYLHGWWD